MICLGRNRKTKKLGLLGSWGLFGGNFGLSISKANVQFFGSVDDGGSSSLGNVGSDFSSIDLVVHEEHFKVSEIFDVESLESVFHAVSFLLVLKIGESWIEALQFSYLLQTNKVVSVIELGLLSNYGLTN